MKTTNKILFTIAALAVAAGCEHKPLGWPGEEYFDKYKEFKFPTHLQADLKWNTPTPERYPGQYDELHYYFLDKDNNVVHHGKEKTMGTIAADINFKYHIDYVHKGNNGKEHYNGAYSIFVSEKEMNTGSHLPADAVPVKYGSQTVSKVPLSELAFSGMDISNVFDTNLTDGSCFSGTKDNVVCGTNEAPVDGKYLTTHAEVEMNKIEARDVKFKIYRSISGGRTLLRVNKYAFADGIYDMTGKKVTVFFGCDEYGQWQTTGIQDGSYKYTATSLTHKKPDGKLYLFCDFYEIDPVMGESNITVRYRICQVIDYTGVITDDPYAGYIVKIENGYPKEAESGLTEFYSTYHSGSSWSTDVQYPVTKLIK